MHQGDQDGDAPQRRCRDEAAALEPRWRRSLAVSMTSAMKPLLDGVERFVRHLEAATAMTSSAGTVMTLLSWPCSTMSCLRSSKSRAGFGVALTSLSLARAISLKVLGGLGLVVARRQ